MFFSSGSMYKNIQYHPELLPIQYQSIVYILNQKNRLVLQDNKNSIVFIVNISGLLYHCAVKITGDKKELYITSFRETKSKDINRKKRGAKVLEDNLRITK